MQPHIQIAVSGQELIQLRLNRSLGLAVISCPFRIFVRFPFINISSDILAGARLRLPSLVNFHIAHASKALSTPVTTVKTPIMRLISVSVDNLGLRGKKAAKS
jgi:hypothetical protein